MREAPSDEEDSDLSEESKQNVKARKVKAKMAASNRDMPPSSSDEEDAVEPIREEVDEEEKKEPAAKAGADEEEEEDSSDDDAELERLYGRNNNKNVKVVPQAKQGAVAVDGADLDSDDDEDGDPDDDEG